ncbi:Alpha-hemolysin translocation ATP-binding protein HlyB [Legionella massiliensis]|uniref:Alpha-hemolysin translocation ATP-binding protein HlyB n=1 Tax=Legionella massiliensis TaxID=1034943 RepID=A0A078KX56_9GAMM|nr:ATP-binding cassette domain-containing protein [Legionella massiliensis]CDZ77627.1 Alpha-hemolysin translocation ATP-binding protein HlyB [Legionella massiliensis]CEE13365.1 Alpha-hemolysin translocation ATP-binding protein HlyB [Legionella massiliensis]
MCELKIKDNRFLLTSLLVLVLFTALATFLRPIMIGFMLQRGGMVHFLILLASISLGILFLSAIRTYFYLQLEIRVLYQLQAGIMRRVLQLPVHFFHHYTIGDLTYRILWITSLSALCSTGKMGQILSFLGLVLGFNLMLYFNWQLTVLVLILVVFFSVLAFWASLRLLPHYEEQRQRTEALYGFMLQVLNGITRVKLFAREAFVESIWLKKYSEVRSLLQKIYNKGIWGYAIFSSVPLFIMCLVFYGASLQTGTLSAEYFIIFFCSLCLLVATMVSFLINSGGIVDSFIAYRRLQPILETAREGSGNYQSENESLEYICFKEVYFHYPDSKRWVLEGLNCQIKSGQHVAFVGLSGSGKSTLLKLLLGFYNPQKGGIELNGRRLEEIDLAQFRANLGVVLQESQLFYGTILDNILGPNDPAETEVWRVLASLSLDNFIAALPMGINTMVSSGLLSGGQKQLLLIARALIKKPKILLLDEATNSLDSETEELVIKGINQLAMTRISIAHRMSTIRSADNIFVLDQGKVVQTGTYQELIKQEGLFYQLAQ